MKIIFPELNNPKIQEALAYCPDVEPVPASDLADACEKLKSGEGKSIVAGIDYPSRDVLLSFKNHLPLKSDFFSSSFICRKDRQTLALADGAVNKLPTNHQLYTITKDTAATFTKCFATTPKIALLSYSTHGSGGKNPDLEKIHFCLAKIRENFPDYLIDGELQLDAAIIPEIAAKKCPDSPLKGAANILITPDLNSGNLLYKSLERFGGWTIAGPLIQGFAYPLADLSRGSSVEDIKLTIEVIQKLCENNENGETNNNPTDDSTAPHQFNANSERNIP